MDDLDAIEEAINFESLGIEVTLDDVVEELIKKFTSDGHAKSNSHRGLKKLMKTRLMQFYTKTRRSRASAAYVQGLQQGKRQAAIDIKPGVNKADYKSSLVSFNDLQDILEDIKGRDNPVEYRELTNGIIDTAIRNKHFTQNIPDKELTGIRQTLSGRFIKWMIEQNLNYIPQTYHSGWSSGYFSVFNQAKKA